MRKTMVAALVAAAAGVLACGSYGNASPSEPASQQPPATVRLPDSSSGYYAVYTAGSNVVLFGKLKESGQESLTLTDVHYIRSSVDKDKKELTNQIVRREMEWHKPRESMIQMRHILLVEPVSEESRVMELIRRTR